MGATHQVLRDVAVEIRKVDHQFDAERQLFADLARADADGGGDVAVGGDLDSALAGDFLDRGEKAGSVTECEQLLRVSMLVTSPR